MRKYFALFLALIMLLAAIPMLQPKRQLTIKVNTCIVFSDLRDRHNG